MSTTLHRRGLIGGAVALSVAALPLDAMLPSTAAAADEGATAFDALSVRKLAQQLAQSPFKPPESRLPDQLAKLTYDQYRQIRFDPQQSLWRGTGLPFEVQFFHRGFLFPSRVDLFEVVSGQAVPIRYRAEQFDFGPGGRPAVQDLGFAGFRIHGPMNRTDYFDEICAFLGASYFRAVAKGQIYGLSARGLSIKTADPGGEEFPVFKAFWLERPAPGSNSMVVTALLDTPSASAVSRMTIRPGEETIFDVEMTLYPRVDIAQPGLGTMTSMYFFDALDRNNIDDYRRAVHDSDGLMMLTGRGEELWRPLANPSALQVSAFSDAGPRGFGLIQRKREFTSYDDLEAQYERRPSLWVEPIGDWGEGVVQLVEIPTRDETHDNIVAFWRPRQPLKAGGEYRFTYRLHWCNQAPVRTDLARVAESRSGLNFTQNARLFVIELVGERLKTVTAEAPPRVAVSADKGKIQNPVAQVNPHTGGWRISFELVPEDAKSVELRAQLFKGDMPISEVWLHRWTS